MIGMTRTPKTPQSEMTMMDVTPASHRRASPIECVTVTALRLLAAAWE
jgi:hypothetical protein